MALNDGQDVVEIMGHPGGQLADGFHFLGLAELVFEGDLLGDVLRDGQEERFAVQLEQFHGHENIPQLAGLGAQAAGEAADGHLLVELLEDGGVLSGIAAEVQLLGGAPDELGVTEPGQLLEALVGIHKLFPAGGTGSPKAWGWL